MSNFVITISICSNITNAEEIEYTFDWSEKVNDFTVEDTENLYMYAWEKGLKGVTIFRDGCKRVGVLTINALITYTYCCVIIAMAVSNDIDWGRLFKAF